MSLDRIVLKHCGVPVCVSFQSGTGVGPAACPSPSPTSFRLPVFPKTVQSGPHRPLPGFACATKREERGKWMCEEEGGTCTSRTVYMPAMTGTHVGTISRHSVGLPLSPSSRLFEAIGGATFCAATVSTGAATRTHAWPPEAFHPSNSHRSQHLASHHVR